MARPKRKAVRSFALKLETLEKIRTVTGEVNLAGGASAIVQNSLDLWFRKYDADPKKWLLDRGIAHTSAPVNEDI